MKRNAVQYTVRNIPENIDRILRRRSRTRGQSFNQTVLEAIILGAGESIRPKRDFSGVIGSITERQAADIEAEIALQRQIDPALWK